MKQDLDWIKDFLVLRETRNFRLAAKRRNISPPAFSRRIKALEAWIGANLFDRGMQSVGLTRSGEKFVSTARQILTLSDKAQSEARKSNESNRNQIRFAVNRGVGMTLLPEWFRRIEKSIGSFRICIRTDYQSLDEYLIALEENTVDFVVGYLNETLETTFSQDKFDVLNLLTTWAVPVCRPDDSGQPIFSVCEDGVGQIPICKFSAYTLLGRLLNTHFEKINI